MMRPQTQEAGPAGGQQLWEAGRGPASVCAGGARQHTAIGPQDPGTHWPVQPQLLHAGQPRGASTRLKPAVRTLLGPGKERLPVLGGH